MNPSPGLNEATLAQECLQRLGDKGSVLHHVQEVLELVAHSGVGLGEVLQDFAHQTLSQLRDLTAAVRHIASGIATSGDRETLSNAYFILNTARLVLDRTPVAMQRNMADALGSDNKLSRADVQKAAHAFQNSPDVSRLLASEDAGAKLVNLLAPAENSISPEKASAFMQVAQY